MPAITAIANYGHDKLPGLFDLNEVLVVIVMVEAMVILLYAIEKLDARRRDKLAEELGEE